MNHIQSRDHALLLELSPLNEKKTVAKVLLSGPQSMGGRARTSVA